MADKPERPEVSPRARLASLYSLAFTFPATIAVSAVIGYYLDQWLGTFPWLSIVMFFFGIGAAFMSLFRVVKAFDESD